MGELRLDWLKTTRGIMKIVLIIASAVPPALYYSKYACLRTATPMKLAYLIAPTNSFVLFYFIVSYLFDGNKPGKLLYMEAGFDIVQALLNVAIGGMILNDYQDYYRLVHDTEGCAATGAMFIILAIFQLADAFFLIVKRESNE